jgi:hypothetical protein
VVKAESSYTVAIETYPFLALDRLDEMLARVLWFPGELKYRYVFLNRERGEYVDLRSDLGINLGKAVPIYSVGIRARGGFAALRSIRRDGKWVEPPGWMENATMALVSMQRESLFYREVRVERLPVKDLSPNEESDPR